MRDMSVDSTRGLLETANSHRAQRATEQAIIRGGCPFGNTEASGQEYKNPSSTGNVSCKSEVNLAGHRIIKKPRR